VGETYESPRCEVAEDQLFRMVSHGEGIPIHDLRFDGFFFARWLDFTHNGRYFVTRSPNLLSSYPSAGFAPFAFTTSSEPKEIRARFLEGSCQVATFYAINSGARVMQ
jgi:hypothetical protein